MLPSGQTWVSLYYFSLPRVNLQLVQDKKYNCEIADLIKRSADETRLASPLPLQEAGWSGVPPLSRPTIFVPMLPHSITLTSRCFLPQGSQRPRCSSLQAVCYTGDC